MHPPEAHSVIKTVKSTGRPARSKSPAVKSPAKPANPVVDSTEVHEDFSQGLSAIVGKLIRMQRVGKGWSIKHFAELSSVSVPAIQKLETGETQPATETIQKLCSALGSNAAAVIAAALIEQSMQRGEDVSPELASLAKLYNASIMFIGSHQTRPTA